MIWLAVSQLTADGFAEYKPSDNSAMVVVACSCRDLWRYYVLFLFLYRCSSKKPFAETDAGYLVRRTSLNANKARWYVPVCV
eukprot:scaffold271371_cov63-Attheya_sp.AAC.1